MTRCDGKYGVVRAGCGKVVKRKLNESVEFGTMNITFCYGQ